MTERNRLFEATKQGDVEEVKAVLDDNPQLINERDDMGATALHHAAFAGHRAVVQLLVQQGADLNAVDSQVGATPTGWAIEYLREMGGFLAIELDDLAYAIKRGDVVWVTRFLRRFPTLREASDRQGRPFKALARTAGNPEIAKLFA